MQTKQNDYLLFNKAGLHKEQGVFFGDKDAQAWHPWSGEYKIMQTLSGDCNELYPETVLQAWQELRVTKEFV
ncbi:hypothetical protein F7Q90_17265 [Pantoea stewartii subsp. stewartii]|nr:hypothetical protein F7Q90_17265 [Pantoea stewartii subsp. stewartii]